jgi:hypothetical protein
MNDTSAKLTKASNQTSISVTVLRLRVFCRAKVAVSNRAATAIAWGSGLPIGSPVRAFKM